MQALSASQKNLIAFVETKANNLQKHKRFKILCQYAPIYTNIRSGKQLYENTEI